MSAPDEKTEQRSEPSPAPAAAPEPKQRGSKARAPAPASAPAPELAAEPKAAAAPEPKAKARAGYVRCKVVISNVVDSSGKTHKPGTVAEFSLADARSLPRFLKPVEE